MNDMKRPPLASHGDEGASSCKQCRLLEEALVQVTKDRDKLIGEKACLKAELDAAEAWASFFPAAIRHALQGRDQAGYQEFLDSIYARYLKPRATKPPAKPEITEYRVDPGDLDA